MTTPPKIDVSHQQRQIIIICVWWSFRKPVKICRHLYCYHENHHNNYQGKVSLRNTKQQKNQDEIKTINLEMFWGTGDVKKFVSFRYCWLGHAFINVVIYIYCFVLFRIKKDIRYKNLELKHCLHLSWNVHIFYELSFHFVTVCVFHDVLLYIRFYLAPNQFIFLSLVSI